MNVVSSRQSTRGSQCANRRSRLTIRESEKHRTWEYRIGAEQLERRAGVWCPLVKGAETCRMALALNEPKFCGCCCAGWRWQAPKTQSSHGPLSNAGADSATGKLGRGSPICIDASGSSDSWRSSSKPIRATQKHFGDARFCLLANALGTAVRDKGESLREVIWIQSIRDHLFQV